MKRRKCFLGIATIKWNGPIGIKQSFIKLLYILLAMVSYNIELWQTLMFINITNTENLKVVRYICIQNGIELVLLNELQ